MKKIISLTLILCTSFIVEAQITESSVTLTGAFDQLKFIPSGQSNRYFFMSKPASSIAFGQYSPEDGGWFTYWKTGSGDMIVRKGNVGIGTTNPSEQLHVTNAIRAGNYRFNSNGHIIDDARYDNYILSWAWDGNYGDHTKINWGGNGAGTDLIISEAKGLIWDGKFTTEEVKVEVVNPPDFVFNVDYNLRSLAETEAYIKQNHHLPEVPSAAEMEANGIELGKMNMLLLQKIEELTLYMIEQQKEIQGLKNEVNQLKPKQK